MLLEEVDLLDLLEELVLVFLELDFLEVQELLEVDLEVEEEVLEEMELLVTGLPKVLVVQEFLLHISQVFQQILLV
jgi:hypothetical protein